MLVSLAVGPYPAARAQAPAALPPAPLVTVRFVPTRSLASVPADVDHPLVWYGAERALVTDLLPDEGSERFNLSNSAALTSGGEVPRAEEPVPELSSTDDFTGGATTATETVSGSPGSETPAPESGDATTSSSTAPDVTATTTSSTSGDLLTDVLGELTGSGSAETAPAGPVLPEGVTPPNPEPEPAKSSEPTPPAEAPPTEAAPAEVLPPVEQPPAPAPEPAPAPAPLDAGGIEDAEQAAVGPELPVVGPSNPSAAEAPSTPVSGASGGAASTPAPEPTDAVAEPAAVPETPEPVAPSSAPDVASPAETATGSAAFVGPLLPGVPPSSGSPISADPIGEAIGELSGIPTSSPTDLGTGTASGTLPVSGDGDSVPEPGGLAASGSTPSDANLATSGPGGLASSTGASSAVPAVHLVESAPLELSGFTLASGGPTGTPSYRGLRSLAASLSLRARGFSGSDLLVQYSAGGRAWQDAGSVDLSAEASNALSGGYVSVELPKQLMKDLGTLHLRVVYRSPEGAPVPAGTELYVDGLALSAVYTAEPDEDAIDDDILSKQQDILDPEAFLELTFQTKVVDLTVPGDPSKPFVIGRSMGGRNVPLRMAMVGADPGAAGRRVIATSGSSTVDQVAYEEAFPGTDVTYDVTDTGLKETIILKDPELHPARFRYLLNLSDFDARQVSPSRIVLYDKGRGGQQLFKRYVLSAPYMVDAAGRRSELVTFKLKQNLLTIVPDESFLADAAYPVAIDPNVDVTVLNVHAHPQAGDNWTVDFVTAGTADLTITPGDQDTVDDDEFVSLSCGAEDRTGQASILPGDVISAPNWTCDGQVATVVHRTLKTGHHHLLFDFGGSQSDAYNAAVSWDGGGDGVSWFDPINWSGDAVPTAVDDVVINAATTTVSYSTTAAYTVQSLTIGNSGGTNVSTLRFTLDNIGSGTPLTVTNDFIVHPSANVNHTAATTSIIGRAFISVGGNATVAGSMNVDGLGYTGGTGNANGNGPGGGSLGDANNGGGGAHGGLGGMAGGTLGQGTPYDDWRQPTELGSGGSGQGGGNGGAGGGAVKLRVTGTLAVTGSITARGVVGTCWNAGGGAGGSIWIDAGTLAGTTGTVRANGGNGCTGTTFSGGGGGGGGIIAMYYTTSTETWTKLNYGGSNPTSFAQAVTFGGAGPIYRKSAAQTYGDLTLDGNNQLSSNDLPSFGLTSLVASSSATKTWDSLTVASRTTFYLGSSASTATFTNVTLANAGAYEARAGTNLIVSGTTTWSGGDVIDSGGSFPVINDGGDLLVPTSSTLMVAIASTATGSLRSYGRVTVAGILTHQSNGNRGGAYRYLPNASSATSSFYRVNLAATNGFTLGSSGIIDLSARGFNKNTGFGAGPTTTNGAAGGSYGGLGGSGSDSSSTQAYGDVGWPIFPGSGGGNTTACCSIGVGGSGGGVLILSVTGTTTISGMINATGGTPETGDSRAGSGAGGAAIIMTTGLAGSGTISVRGGAAGGNTGGSGGGGRVAVYCTFDASSLTVTTSGGGGAATVDRTGGAGTYLKQCNGAGAPDLTVDGGGVGSGDDRFMKVTPLTASSTVLVFGTITATNSGVLSLSGINATTTNFVAAGAGGYRAVSGTTLNVTGTTTWAGGTIYDNGGSFNVITENQDLFVPTSSKLVSDYPGGATRTYANVTVAGTVTHTDNPNATSGTASASLYKLNYTATGGLTLTSTGRIDVSARGYHSSRGLCAGTYTGSGNGGGGCYGGGGGEGAQGTTGHNYGGAATYGLLQAPFELGSGGALGSAVSNFEMGGGAVKLTVLGTTTILGAIRAQGATASGVFLTSGGGSGGSIWLTTGGLAGSGSFDAFGSSIFFGPNNFSDGGAGGGGRIAVYYTNDLSTVSYNYGGGSNTWDNQSKAYGGSGTLFRKSAAQTNGDLTVDNGGLGGADERRFATTTLFSSNTNSSVFDTVTVTDSARVSMSGVTSVTSSVFNLTNNGLFEFFPGVNFSPGTFNWNGGILSDAGGSFGPIAQGGDLFVPTGTRLILRELNATRTYANATIAGTLQHAFNISVSGGTASASQYKLNYVFTGNLTVPAGGSVDVSRRGFQPYSGVGKGGKFGTLTGGGGYGGYGGSSIGTTTGYAAGGEPYGSSTWPVDLGSSGGNVNYDPYGNNNSDVGGGGAMKLTVGGTFNLLGNLYADGGSTSPSFSFNNDGAGSGGSILVVTNVLTGNGQMLARGGTVAFTFSNGGAGGGGRIATYATTDNSPITRDVSGGAILGAGSNGGFPGTVGTIFPGSRHFQENYRWYGNVDALTPVSPLASENVTSSLFGTTSTARLRMNVFVNADPVPTTTKAYRLQYSSSTAGPWIDVNGVQVGDWMDPGWAKRATVTVTNNGAFALTNYQVPVSLPYDGDMNTDYSDVRFTDSSGTATIPFWFESRTSTSAVAWVKVPTVPTSGTATLYVYYGNLFIGSASDGSSTFDFFDGFDGTGIDPTLWNNGTSAYWTVESGELNGFNTSGRLTSTQAFSNTAPGKIIESKYRVVSAAGDGFVPLGTLISSANGLGLIHGNSGTDQYRNDGAVTSLGATVGLNLNLVTKIVAKSNNTADLTVNNYNTGVNLKTATGVSNTVSAEPIALGERYDNIFTNELYSAFWDWVRVRQLATSEPSTTLTFEQNRVSTGTVEWNFSDNFSVANGALLSSSVLASTTVKENYTEGNPTASNTNAIPVGAYAEWDFSVIPSGVNIFPTTSPTYYFRMVRDVGGQFEIYNRYPAITVGPNNAPVASALGPPNLVNGSWTNTNQPSLTATITDADVGDTVRHHIQIDDTSDFSSPLVDYLSGLGAQGPVTFTVGQATGTGVYFAGTGGQQLPDLSGYYWRIQGVDNSGASGTYAVANGGAIAFRVDTTRPNPGTLSLAVQSTSSVTTTIAGASDVISGLNASPYNYFNGTVGTSTGATTATAVLWSSLSVNTQYSFAVLVSDVATNSSTTATSAAYTFANPPASPSANGTAETQVGVSWGANGNPGPTEFQVENITTTGLSGWITGTSFTSTGLTCSTTYDFRVRARNGDGITTAYAATVSATTLACGTGGGGGGGGGGGELPATSTNACMVINNDEPITYSPVVTLNFSSTLQNPTRLEVSNLPSLLNPVSFSYVPDLAGWNLCTQLASCLPGSYTAYARIYDSSGAFTDILFDDIEYVAGANTSVPPSVSFATSASQGVRSDANPAVSVRLSYPTSAPVSVSYSVGGGTALPNVDYRAPISGTLVFPPNTVATSFSFTVLTPLGSSTGPANPTIVFSLSGPVGATLGTPDQHTYTILDSGVTPCTPGDPECGVDCNLNPTDPACQPVCTATSTDPRCAPVCTATSTDPSCLQPCTATSTDPRCTACTATSTDPACTNYCTDHPEDPACPVDCEAYPLDPRCPQPPPVCTATSTDPLCQSFCILNPTHPSCPQTCVSDPNLPGCPSYCQLHPTDPACQPVCTVGSADPRCAGSCTATSTDPRCTGYCDTHPQDPACGAGGCPPNSTDPNCMLRFCELHPTDPLCTSFCQLHPEDPSCGYCAVYPNSPACSEFCRLNPNDLGCRVPECNPVIDPTCRVTCDPAMATCHTSCDPASEPTCVYHCNPAVDPTCRVTCDPASPYCRNWDPEFCVLHPADVRCTGETSTPPIVPLPLLPTVLLPVLVALDHLAAPLWHLITNLGTLPDIYLSLLKLWYAFLTLCGLRKKRRYWGTVYDSATKQPLDPALVELLDAGTGRVVDRAVTDIAGRYGFLITPGTFRLRATKANYEFPSKRLTGTADDVYDQLYHGEPLTVREDSEGEISTVVAPNVPMDPLGYDWNQAHKKRWIKESPRLRATVDMVLMALFAIGFAASAYAAYRDPSVLHFVLLVFYVLVVFLKLFTKRQRLWGTIYHADGTTLDHRYHLELSAPASGVAVSKSQAGADGKFFLKAEPGSYTLSLYDDGPLGGAPEPRRLTSAYDVTVGPEGVLTADVAV